MYRTVYFVQKATVHYQWELAGRNAVVNVTISPRPLSTPKKIATEASELVFDVNYNIRYEFVVSTGQCFSQNDSFTLG